MLIGNLEKRLDRIEGIMEEVLIGVNRLCILQEIANKQACSVKEKECGCDDKCCDK